MRRPTFRAGSWAHGFAAEAPETVMSGAVSHLVGELDPPPGVRAQRAGEGADLEADVGAGTPQEAHHA